MDENNVLIDEDKKCYYDMPYLKHILIFIIGFGGLYLFGMLYGIIISAVMSGKGIDLVAVQAVFDSLKAGQTEFTESEMLLLGYYYEYSIWSQTLSYITLAICCVCALLVKDCKNIFSNFKKANTWIHGFAYGALLIASTTALSVILNLIRGSSEVNANETIIRALTDRYYIPMFIVTVFCAPIVEELTYRLGLFGLCAKKNKILAFVVSTVVFALLHFNLTAKGAELINELWNLPVYLLSGFILAWAYSREGNIGVSMIAHMTNNLISILMSLFIQQAIMR